jgi:predicted site-specific integrase-resolvase
MEEYISVSTYAARKGVSTQTVRNWVKKGVVQTISFRRGKMNGYLVRCDEKD